MVVGPIFPNELFKQGKLLTPSFSFAMNGYQSDEPSTVDFGNANSMRANLTDRVTLGFNDDFFWSTYIQAVKFGNFSEFAIDGSPYAIFDTGVSHLMVPPMLLEPFIDNIIGAAGGKAEYAIQDGMIFVNCKQRNLFKPISFMFSEYYIQIDPSEYIWDAYGDSTVCSMLLLANQYDFFFFGQPIFHGYYTIHNMTTSTIGYVPLANSNKPRLVRSEIPENVMVPTQPPSFWEQYGPFIFLIICGAIAVYAIKPLLESKWDINNEEDKQKMIYVYVGYGVLCLIIYVFFVAPLIGGEPEIDPNQVQFDRTLLLPIGIFALGARALFKQATPLKKFAKSTKKAKKTSTLTVTDEED